MPVAVTHRPRQPRPVGAVVGVVVLALLLAGCGGAPVVERPALAASEVLAGSPPVRLRIPVLEVDTALTHLGLRPDGTMEVPPDGTTAGWYDRSPTPGELGPAVLAAHVDWNGDEGVFFDLRQLAPGDEVHVRRRDDVTAVFQVRRVERYPKDRFASADVYGDVGYAEIRLITCGGGFDDAARSYRDNVVVYAQLVGSTGA